MNTVAEVTTKHTPQTFREQVAFVAARAKERLPEAVNGRLEGAVKLVLAHDVTRLEDGTIEVGSCTDPLKTYRLVGDTCTCEDWQHGKAPGGWCRHRIAAGIDKRVRETLTAEPAPHEARATEPVHGIAREHVVVLHGKEYVLYAGLIAQARQQGLTSLKAEFISVTETLALAKATAVFADGRVFQEASDSSPDNVGKQVRPHWPRMALVRAKARALRDALGIGACSLEELGEA